MKVRVNANTSDNIFVVGLGSVTPNTWFDIDDKQIARFERANGVRIQDSGLEIKAAPKRKKEAE